ncbi:MAG: hypothetical protein KKD75_00780 [Nanoarchaeota archaeon]|nr:hypothetical protein [Nanoarchaeota archaeon]MBU1631748.1 hypothetical protein [Nanoarchaeota archaeon]MBU1875981.1 hypothetical protein [Nanoarchaeota archaeon]
MVQAQKAIRSSSEVNDYRWLSSKAKAIDDTSMKHNFRSYTRNSDNPTVFLIGYDSQAIDDLACFLDDLGEQGILQGCVLLSEGYQGNNSLQKGLMRGSLDDIFRKYNIHPEGNDNAELREQQHDALNDVKRLLKYDSAYNSEVQKKISKAMGSLIARDKGYFLPHILNHAKGDASVIYLLELDNVTSFTLERLLKNNGVKYASFVPTL